MTNVLKASILAAACFSVCGTNAYGQSILNQSKDDLLKDFDVGKSLTAPPQFTGGSNPAPQPTWAPSQPAGAAPRNQVPPGAYPQGGGPQGVNPPGSNQQPPALLGNYGQGPYQYQPQKGLMQRIIEGAMNAVNVSNSDGNGTRIKAPFVDVNVGGPDGVRVKAPFVNYNSDDGPQVKAPFVKYNSADGPQVKAPFVKYNSAGGPQVKAPFVKYNSADGAQVKAPFVNINSPGTSQDSSLK